MSEWGTKVRRWWRRAFRSPYVRDLRLIAPRYRPLYRRHFERGDCGSALGALWRAYDAGHFCSMTAHNPQGDE